MINHAYVLYKSVVLVFSYCYRKKLAISVTLTMQCGVAGMIFAYQRKLNTWTSRRAAKIPPRIE